MERTQNIAIGLAGEPVALGSANGLTVNMNSQRLRAERCLRALQRFRGDCSNPDVSARMRPPGLGCPFRVVVQPSIAITGLAIPLCR
jgi:hypothetical protein